MNEKLYENILNYDVVHKTPHGAKPLHINFDKVDVYVFHSDEKYVRIFDEIMLKSNIPDIYSHKYTKIKITPDDNLPLENMTELNT